MAMELEFVALETPSTTSPIVCMLYGDISYALDFHTNPGIVVCTASRQCSEHCFTKADIKIKHFKLLYVR